MDWKLFGTTYLAIFLAEMGDKTQLATFGLAGAHHRPLLIFFSAALALVTVTALGVTAGTLVARFLSPVFIRKASAVLFITLGLWTWFKS